MGGKGWEEDERGREREGEEGERQEDRGGGRGTSWCVSRREEGSTMRRVKKDSRKISVLGKITMCMLHTHIQVSAPFHSLKDVTHGI